MCQKQYAAVLTQGGPNPPQEIIFQSSFNNPIIWTRVVEGEYKGSLLGGWIKERTHVLINATAGGSVLLAGAIITSDGEVTLYFNNEDSVNTINLVITYFL